MDAAVERTGMYLQRVQKTYVDQLLYALVKSQGILTCIDDYFLY